MASPDVVEVLQRLGHAIVAAPAQLPAIEHQLGVLQDGKGVSAFCREVVAVLAGEVPEVGGDVGRQAAGMVVKQIIERNPGGVGADDLIIEKLVKSVRDPVHAVANAACGILSIFRVGWAVALPMLLGLLSTGLPGVFYSISTILEASGSDLTICSLCATALPQILTAASAAPSPEALHLLCLIYEIPEIHDDEQRSVTVAQEMSADGYCRFLLGVPTKSHVLANLPGTVQFWGVLRDPQIIPGLLSLALNALKTGSEVEKTLAVRFWGEAAGFDHQIFQGNLAVEVFRELIVCLQYTNEVLADKEGLVNENDSHLPDEERGLTFYGNPAADEPAEDDDEDDTSHHVQPTLADEGNLRAESHLTAMILSEEAPLAVVETILPMLANIDNLPWKMQEAVLTSLGASAAGAMQHTATVADRITTALITTADTSKFGLVRAASLSAMTELHTMWVDGGEDMEDDEEDEENVAAPGTSSPSMTATQLLAAMKCLTRHLSDPNKKSQRSAIDGVTQLYPSLATCGGDPGMACLKCMVTTALSDTIQAANRMAAFEKISFMVKDGPEQFTDPTDEILTKLLQYVTMVAARVNVDGFAKRPEAAAVLWSVMQIINEKGDKINHAILNQVLDICRGVIEAVGSMAHAGIEGGMGPAITAIDSISAVSDQVPELFQGNAEKVLATLSTWMTLLKAYHATHADSGRQTCQHLVHSLASLTGDLVTNCYQTISLHLPTLTTFFCNDILSTAEGTISCDTSSVDGSQAISNVLWALGVIVGKTEDLSKAFCDVGTVTALGEYVVGVCRSEDASIQESLHQNACCLLSSLVGKLPQITADVMLAIIPGWLPAVAGLEDGSERTLCVESLHKLQNPHLTLCAGVLTRSPQPSITSGVSATNVPGFDLAVIFGFYNRRASRYLNYTEVNELFTSAAPVTPLDEAGWKAMCKAYVCSPSTGINRERLGKMYTAGLRDVNADFAVVSQRVATGAF